MDDISSVAIVGSDRQELVWIHPPADAGEYRIRRRLEHAAQRLLIPGPYGYEIVRQT